MALVSAVIDRAQDICPGLDDTRGLTYFLAAYREILDRVRFRDKTVTLSSLVAGTREYEWDETNVKAWQALYLRDSSDEGTPMDILSVDEMDIKFHGWQTKTGRGTPNIIYFRTATDTNTSKTMVGFHEIPDTSSSASYPQVQVFCTAYTALVAGDTVPPMFMNEEVFVSRIAYYFNRDLEDWANTQAWDAISEREIERNVQHIKNITARKKGRFHRTWMEGRSSRG